MGSVIAATLATGGICPITSEKVFKIETVRDCLTLMYGCGMYDYSGEFYYGPVNKVKSGLISEIVLQKFSILGTNCVVVPGAKIGVGTAIGANCLVAQKLKPWKIYQGFPLRAYFNRKKAFIKKFNLK